MDPLRHVFLILVFGAFCVSLDTGADFPRDAEPARRDMRSEGPAAAASVVRPPAAASDCRSSHRLDAEPVAPRPRRCLVV